MPISTTNEREILAEEIRGMVRQILGKPGIKLNDLHRQSIANLTVMREAYMVADEYITRMKAVDMLIDELSCMNDKGKKRFKTIANWIKENL